MQQNSVYRTTTPAQERRFNELVSKWLTEDVIMGNKKLPQTCIVSLEVIDITLLELISLKLCHVVLT